MNTFKQVLKDASPLMSILNLAGSGLVGVLAVQIYLGFAPNIWLGLAFMGIIFAVYTFNRFTDSQEDQANGVNARSPFLNTRIYQMGWLIFLTSTCLIILQHFTAIKFLLVASAMLVSVAYSYRIIPHTIKDKEISVRRFKEITLVKNILIASFWSISIFTLPLLFASRNIPNSSPIYFLAISLFVLTLSSSLFGDIRDEIGDRIAGVQTLPVIFGKQKSYLFLFLVSLFWCISAFYAYQQHLLDLHHLCFIVAMGSYPFTYLLPYSLRWGSPALLDFICDLDLWIFSAGLASLKTF